MLSVLLDSSVLFSAIYSNKGHARDLIVLAEQRQISLIISEYIYAEVQKNFQKKATGLVPLLDQFIQIVPIQVVKNPPKKLLKEVGTYIHQKDASIVAAAIDQNVDFLVSFDQKDLVQNKMALSSSVVKIVLPKVVVSKFNF